MAFEKEILEYGIKLDPKQVIKSADQMQKAINVRLKKIDKTEKQINTTMGKFLTRMRKVKPDFAPMLKAIDNMSDEFEAAMGTAKTYKKSLERLGHEEITRYQELLKVKKELKALEARSTEGEVAKDVLDAKKKQVKTLEDAYEVTKTNIKTAKFEYDLAKEQTAEKKKAYAEMLKEAQEATETEMPLFPKIAREAGSEIVKPFAAFMKKDLPGAMEAAVELASKAGRGVKTMAGMEYKDVKRGGMTGGAMKGMIGVSKALMGIAGIFKTIAPFLGILGSGIMGLVKLFLDLEAAAKDFNKGVLETTSTSGYLSDSFGNVSAASAALEKDLKAVRDGAMDLSNVQWGISKETAQAFISSLAAEGVTLQRLRKETERLGGETDRATGYAKSYAQVIQMGVAYSRAFGVSLNEVSQLQGELMTEIGMGLDSVEASFQMIVKGAEEAGMASNKFFGLVKSFSADLGLFTLRMAELTKVMGVLGKVMSPRNAQKFMQTLAGKFGGGLTENIRMTVMAGKKGVAITKKDLETKLTGLSEDLRGANIQGVDDLIDRLRKGEMNADEIAKWVAQQGGKVSGTLREAIIETANFQKKAHSGDVIDQASILDQNGLIAKYQQLQAISTTQFHSRLEDISGDNLNAIVNAGVATVDEIRNMQKLEVGIKTAQQELIEGVRKGPTVDQLDKLKKLGIDTKLSAEDQIAKLEEIFKNDKDWARTWDMLSIDQRKALEGSAETIDYQKEIANKQTSIVDQIGILVDVIMNYVYGWLDKIYVFLKEWGLGSLTREEAFESQAAQTGDPAIVKAVRDSEGDIWKARNTIVATQGRQMLADVEAVEKQAMKLREDIIKTGSEVQRKELEAQLKALGPVLGHEWKEIVEDVKLDKKQLEQMAPEKLLKVIEEVNKALAKTGAKGTGVVAVPGKPAPTAPGKPAAPTAPGKPAPTTPTAPGKPASTTPTAASDREQKKTKKAIDEGRKAAAKDAKKTATQIKAVEKVFTKPPEGYKQAITDSTLDALRKALFEYYMYSESGMTPADIAARMKEGGFTPETWAKTVGEGARRGETAATATMRGGAAGGGGGKGKGKKSGTAVPGGYDLKAGEGPMSTAAPAQGGGWVTSIVNGKANISRLPPGEGWTPIGVGERIVPAGGRGGGRGGNVKVELALKGDLGRFITARVVEGTAQFERDKRLR